MPRHHIEPIEHSIQLRPATPEADEAYRSVERKWRILNDWTGLLSFEFADPLSMTMYGLLLLKQGQRDFSEATEPEAIRKALQVSLSGLLICAREAIFNDKIAIKSGRETLLEPMTLLLEAIKDLDYGVLAPWLAPLPKKPESSIRQREFRKACVRISDLLKESGMNRGLADKLVMRRLAATAKQLGFRPLDWTDNTIKNWRTKYNQARKDDQAEELEHRLWRMSVDAREKQEQQHQYPIKRQRVVDAAPSFPSLLDQYDQMAREDEYHYKQHKAAMDIIKGRICWKLADDRLSYLKNIHM